MELTRGIHADTLAALAAGGYRPGVMVHVDWPDDPVWVHSGRGTFTWDGHDWVGVMGFADLDIPADEVEGAIVRAMLSAVMPDDEMATLLAKDVRRRRVAIYSVLTTERAGAVIVGAPIEVWSGSIASLGERELGEWPELETRLDVGAVSGAPARASATVTHSLEDQVRDYPADTIGRLLQRAIEKARRVR